MNEPQKKPNLLCTFLKAYWWAILIILAVPILLNFIVLIPAFLPIVGGSVEWLSFHGSYIGSVIASLITLYVLYKQLQHNHEENEKTRRENQVVNEKNRQLQLDLLKYEQEKQWLQEMRTACVNNVCSYNNNDVQEICIAFSFHPNLEYILSKVKVVMNRLAQTDTTIGFLMFKIDSDSWSLKFDKEKEKLYKEYIQIIKDIQTLANFINQNVHNIQIGLLVSSNLSTDVKTSVETMIIIPQLSNVDDINSRLAMIAIQRSAAASVIYESIRTASFNYLKKQQERINKILTEEHGTR